jgi:hypothetical protein
MFDCIHAGGEDGSLPFCQKPRPPSSSNDIRSLEIGDIEGAMKPRFIFLMMPPSLKGVSNAEDSETAADVT